MFSSLRMTSTLNLIGAIVGVYAAGGGQGLGYERITAKQSIDAALVTAITLVATRTGVVVLLAGGGIVVVHVEQAHAAAVAGAQDRGNWRVVTQPCARVVEQRPQILVGRGGVADLELDGLADSWPGPNRQRSGVLVDTQQVANEEA